MFTEIFRNSIMEQTKGYTMIEFENNAYFFLTIRYSKSRFKNDAFGHT